MTVPGLLIEYLITGAFALAWVGCLVFLSTTGPRSLDDLTAAHVTFLLPIAYVLGTFIDYLGRELTRAIDKNLGHRGKHGTDEYYVKLKFCFMPPAIREEVVRVAGKEEMFIRAPEAAKQYELRKARDRVARGVLTNFVIMDLVALPVLAFRDLPNIAYYAFMLLGFTWLSYRVWAKMVELTVKFRNDVSIEFLREDEAAAANDGQSASSSPAASTS